MRIEPFIAMVLIIPVDCDRGCHNHPTPHNVLQRSSIHAIHISFTVYKEVIDQAGYTFPEIGMRKLNSHLTEFGLGRKISIDLPSEKAGNLPGPLISIRSMVPENGDHHTSYPWVLARENFN